MRMLTPAKMKCAKVNCTVPRRGRSGKVTVKF